jgi:medium-chain acyl-[acyl-carrier-protein] hydrolase
MVKQKEKSPWFVIDHIKKRAKIQLFCFPYAGASSNVYSAWQKKFKDNEDVEIIAVELPGRGTRINEPLLDDMDQLTYKLTNEVLNTCCENIIFFGHSLGAITSFSLALSLQKKGISLKHHFISAMKAPSLLHTLPQVRALNDQELIELLINYNSTLQSLISNDEIKEIFLPILKSDIMLRQSFKPNFTDKLVTNLTLVFGEFDNSVTRDEMLLWKNNYQGEVDVYSFSGDHFFVKSCEGQVLSLIDRKLSVLLDGVHIAF